MTFTVPAAAMGRRAHALPTFAILLLLAAPAAVRAQNFSVTAPASITGTGGGTTDFNFLFANTFPGMPDLTVNNATFIPNDVNGGPLTPIFTPFNLLSGTTGQQQPITFDFTGYDAHSAPLTFTGDLSYTASNASNPGDPSTYIADSGPISVTVNPATMPAPAPEPSGLQTFGFALGLLGLGVAWRRRAARSA